MKVLITGGAGFVGSHLAELLLDRGDSVVAIDDLSTGSIENVQHLRANPSFQLVVETILNEMVVDRLVSECDVVYHLAAAVGVELIVKDPVGVIETNIIGSEVVLKTADRYRKRILITSTSEVYGKNTNKPFREEDDSVLGQTKKHRWSYACSKAIDEFLALAYHKQRSLPVIIVRLFNTVGPRQTGRYGMVIPRFVIQALNNEPVTVYGDGTQTRTFTYVGDVIEALAELMDTDLAIGDIFNIGGVEEISIFSLAKRVKEKTASASPIKFISYDDAYEEGFEDMMQRVPDITKVSKLIGFEPKTNLDTILDKVIKYQKSLQKVTYDVDDIRQSKHIEIAEKLTAKV